MFENYTEDARRVIFFARYEATILGAPCIDTDHILLGLLREGGELLGFGQDDVELIRRDIQQRSSPQGPLMVSPDLPLSIESERVLDFAAQEARRLAQQKVKIHHIILGLLKVKNSVTAQSLRRHGITLQEVTERLQQVEGIEGSYVLEDSTEEEEAAQTEDFSFGARIQFLKTLKRIIRIR